MTATVDPVKQRVTLEGRLSVVAGADALSSVPIWTVTPTGSAEELSFDDPAGGPIPRLKVDQAARGDGASRRGTGGLPRREDCGAE